MPVAEQLVVQCDHAECDQMVTAKTSMTDGPLDQAIDSLLDDRSWGKVNVTRDGVPDRLFYCPAHAAELQPFLGGQAPIVQLAP